MTLQLFPEEIEPTTLSDRARARVAVALAYLLSRRSPERIAKTLSRWVDRYPAATEKEARRDRSAVCTVSGRCRGQEGCLQRSLATVIASRLRHKSLGWCSGIATDPFRAHAWVEVDGSPVQEFSEITDYVKTLEIAPSRPKATLKSRIDSGNASDDQDDIVRPGSVTQLLRLTLGHRKTFVGIGILSLLSMAVMLAIPKVAAILVHDATNGNITQMGPMVVLLLALVLSSACASACQHYFLARIGETVVNRARRDLGRQVVSLSIAEYDKRSGGDLLSRVVSDASRLRIGILQGVTAAMSGLPLVAGAAVMMAWVDLVLFGVAVLSILAVLILVITTGRLVQDASLSAQQTLGALSSRLDRNIRGVRTLRASNATASEIANVDTLVERNWRAGLKVAQLQSLVSPMANIGTELAGIFILLVGAYRLAQGTMTVGDLTQFVVLIFILVMPLSQMMSAASEIAESLAALSRINEIIDIPVEEAFDVPPSLVLHKNVEARSDEAIALDRVSFSYQSESFGDQEQLDGAETILYDLSLSVRMGERVAIVGPSGAGKSTILQLLERFYEVSSGQIRVLGKPIESYTRQELRSQLAYVEQDAPILAGTLRENLLLGLRRDIPDSICEQTLVRVGLNNLLARSDSGLDQSVGENGAALSGGERQRLAFARALLSDAPIILLDEATANLDALTERKMSGLMRNHLHGRAVLMVAHRLSSIVDADRICLLEHGRLVAQGSHSSLIKSSELYRRMAEEQHLLNGFGSSSEENYG